MLLRSGRQIFRPFPLYNGLGFKETGRRTNYYENGEDALLMEYFYANSTRKVAMQFKSMIISNSEVSPGYFKMRLTVPHDMLTSLPGQFVMVKVRDAIDPLLRRPFGIFDLGILPPDFSGGNEQPYMDMLYRVVGRGTAMLASLHHGDHVDILGPLGRGFSHGTPAEEKILVGGGVGLAPLYYLAKKLVATAPVQAVHRRQKQRRHPLRHRVRTAGCGDLRCH